MADKLKPLHGPGAVRGSIPTDIEQATGPERYELLKKLEGRIPFYDQRPLVVTQRATLTNPIVVKSLSRERQVGCTGM